MNCWKRIVYCGCTAQALSTHSNQQHRLQVARDVSMRVEGKAKYRSIRQKTHVPMRTAGVALTTKASSVPLLMGLACASSILPPLHGSFSRLDPRLLGISAETGKSLDTCSLPWNTLSTPAFRQSASKTLDVNPSDLSPYAKSGRPCSAALTLWSSLKVCASRLIRKVAVPMDA